MSEQFKDNHEYKESTETSHEASSDVLKQKHERELTHVEKQHGSNEHLEAIRNKVERQAPNEHQQHLHAEKDHANNHPVLVNKQLKDMAFSRSMTRVRKKLPAPSRAFSKVIHNSAVDKSSEFIGKTIARPTSMLTGAFVAFVGTSALLWITRHYGYEYNYLLVILLFVGGAILGASIEGLWRMTHKNRD